MRRLGYPEAFIRMWDYYLCYCEGGFAERQLGDVQMLLTKPRCRLPAVIQRVTYYRGPGGTVRIRPGTPILPGAYP